MTDALTALHDSIGRLTALVRPLPDDAITTPAYPSEWSIADVMSHLGSGAVISSRRLVDGLAGTVAPEGFNQQVWAEWDAKSPRCQVDEALSSLASFDGALAAVPEGQRQSFHSSMGPMQLDWDRFVGMRLSEQLLHEWDVAVALDPSATLPADAVELLIDNLAPVARFAGTPAGHPRAVSVTTTAPERHLQVVIRADAVALDPGTDDVAADVTLPAEAFIRLVYGRLDPAHTPSSVTGDPAALDQLRDVFRGF